MIIKEFIRESNKIEGVTDEKAVEKSYEAWGFIAEKELTHETVKETHELILENRQPDIAGEYRTTPVRIGGEIRDNHAVIHDEMEALLDKEPSNAVEAILWHVEFEKIHPFTDGNGRIGRLLYLWHCNKLNEEPVLWRADDRQGYYSLFNIDKNKLDSYWK
jgi:Fic family protein